VHPRVAVARLDDGVRHPRNLLRHFSVLAPHEALDGKHRAVGGGGALPLGPLATEALPFLCQCNHRGGGPRTFLVDDDRRLPAFHDGNDRVCRAQIDSDDFAHLVLSLREQNHSGCMSVCQAFYLSLLASYYPRTMIRCPTSTVHGQQ